MNVLPIPTPTPISTPTSVSFPTPIHRPEIVGLNFVIIC